MTYNEERENEISRADNTLARSQQNEEEMQLELDDRHCPTCKCNDDERDINYHYKIRHCPNCDARVWCQECCSEL